MESLQQTKSQNHYKVALVHNENYLHCKTTSYLKDGHCRMLASAADAIRELGLALEHNCRNGLAWALRGDILQGIGAHFSAVDDYTEAIKLKDCDSNLYRCRADAKRDICDFIGATDDYDKALYYDAEDYLAYFGRGTVNATIGKHEDACKDFEEVLKIHPHHLDTKAALFKSTEKLNEKGT